MNIFVCLKQVPGTDQPIKINPDGTGVSTEGIDTIISPYDEYALEEALRIREKFGPCTVTAVTLGPDSCQKSLRDALALGVDEAIHLNDPLFEKADPYQTALALAAALKSRNPDLVLTGKQAVDDDAAMVGQAMAEFMGLPHVTEIKKLTFSDDHTRITAHRETEGGAEVVTCALPVVLTAQKGLNEPRYKSLKGIMAAKKKTITVLNAQAIGLDASVMGSDARRIRVRKVAYPEARPHTGVKLITGSSTDETVREAVRVLKEELKVI